MESANCLLASFMLLLLFCPWLASCQQGATYNAINGSLCINANFTDTRGAMSEMLCAAFCSDKPNCQAFTVADGPCQLFIFDKCSKYVRACNCSRTGPVFVRQRSGLQPGALCPSGYGDGQCGVRYKLTGSNANWQTQQAKCQAESGSLVIFADVIDVAEMALINQIYTKYSVRFFLGGLQPPGSVEPAGGWYWVACNITLDGSLWGTANGEPNNNNGNESVVFKSVNLNLADQEDSISVIQGLCECLSPFD